MFLIPKFKNTDYQIGLRYKKSIFALSKEHISPSITDST